MRFLKPVRFLTYAILLAIAVVITRQRYFIEVRLGSEILKPLPSLCRLHKVKMSVHEVPIAYGLIIFSKEDDELKKAQAVEFPNAVDFILGGCVVSDSSPRTEYVSECANCRQAKIMWLSTRPKTEQEKPANQAPLPTTMSVTPRADARFAPATVAAEL